MITIAAQEKLVPGPTLAQRLGMLAALGVTDVELRGKDVRDRDPQEIERALDATGCRVSAVCMGYRGALLSPEPAQRWLAVDDLRRLLDAAERFGAAGVVVVLAVEPYAPAPLTPLSDAERDRLTGRALETLAAIDRHARHLRARVLLEPRNRYETVIVRTLAEGARLLRDLGGGSVRLLADTFHMNIEEAGIPAALTAHAADIGYVQLADNNRELPGHGSLDFAAIFDALVRAGYRGFAALEAWDLAGRPNEAAVGASVAALRRYAAHLACYTPEVMS